MNTVALTLALASAIQGASTLSGQVVGPDGDPVSGAQVFVEQGLDSRLVFVKTGEDGQFFFENIGAGLTGVFAVADGLAFGGLSVNLAINESRAGLAIHLRKRERIEGRISGEKRGAVEGARVTRIVLLGAQSVSIPLTKLAEHGFRTPVTDERGRFVVDALPRGVETALKIAHPDFAQEGVTGVNVGNHKLEIELTEGVFVTGDVRSQSTDRPVSNASIVVRNAQPPYDTITTRTDGHGSFAMRLKPGAYLYRAAGPAYQSHGWKPLGITGELPAQQVALYVTGTGDLNGKVMNAVTGAPVQGARLLLEFQGIPAQYARTGPGGEFVLSAAAGNYVLTLDTVPGYLLPKERAMNVQVASAQATELPSFWLAPNPTYSIQVLDGDGAPASDSVVRVLRPPQLGWRATDETGRVDLEFLQLPQDGMIVGFVEHAARNEGALFAIAKDNARDAVVQLLPLTTVNGRVFSGHDQGVPGQVVEGRFVLDLSSDAIVLWQTVTDAEGEFTWPGIVPQIPQLCLAYHPDDPDQQQATTSFVSGLDKTTDLGTLTIPKPQKGKSLLGKKLKWRGLPARCGEVDVLPEEGVAIVAYTTPENAAAMIDAAARAQELTADIGATFAVVIDGEYACESAPIPVFSGEAPGTATTYVIDARGTVVLETFNLPPVFALSRVGSAAQ